MSTVCNFTGIIFDIQRFCLHDGPGIRTTVFLKGCPLSCAWCHNPESQKGCPQLMYYAKSCIGCGECARVCESNAHTLKDGRHVFNIKLCRGCMKCTEVCYADALHRSGEEKSADDIIDTVLRDKPFFGGGGGVTFSGGEPFYQPHFLLELAKRAKSEGLHVCIETSGAAKREHLLEAAKYTDLFLFDCKLQPGAAHKKYIGCSGNELIDNLMVLDSIGARTILRCPIIPEINDSKEHFSYIASLATKLRNLTAINIQPYHATGLQKSHALGERPKYLQEGFDPQAFKERIKNELLPVLTALTSVDTVLF